ncbi:MAG: SurA N-terminal domain-containing protein [Myxococcota bacterium]
MVTRFAAALLFASLLAPVVRADIVERVVATVNDRAIFLSDLRKRAVPFLPQIAESATETERAARLKELYSELLNFLIEEELLKQVAAQDGTIVTEADVDQAIVNIRTGNGLTEEQFMEAVEAQGFTEQAYRRDLKKQLLRFKVINERVRSRVNITEEEVRRRYEQRARGEGQELRFKVAYLVIDLEPDANATDVARARKQANAIRATLTPDNFMVEAEALGGGDLGWIAEGDLPEDLGEALFALSPGEISAPIRGSRGFNIFFVEDRQVGSDFPTYDEMKDELFREMLDVQMRRQERVFIEELRRDAIINRML